MNKENCALKLVDEIILYYDARSKKHQIRFLYFLHCLLFKNEHDVLHAGSVSVLCSMVGTREEHLLNYVQHQAKRRLDLNNIHGIADYPVPGVTDDDVMEPAGGCGRYCMTNFPSLPPLLNCQPTSRLTCNQWHIINALSHITGIRISMCVMNSGCYISLNMNYVSATTRTRMLHHNKCGKRVITLIVNSVH